MVVSNILDIVAGVDDDWLAILVGALRQIEHEGGIELAGDESILVPLPQLL